MSDVRLRAFRADEYEAVLAHAVGVGGQGREQRLARIAASGTRYGTEILLGVEAGGRLVGEVQARFDGNLIPPGVFEIGIELWDPRDRGRGLGRAAVDALLTYLFEREGAERIQGSTDLENVPMRATFASLGFREEGILRGFMPSPDGYRDYVLYGITRADRAGG